MNNNKKISLDCPKCKAFQTFEFKDPAENVHINCGYCNADLYLKNLTQDVVESCPVCGGKELHQHKDFNKKLGFVILVFGAVLIPYTYAVSFIIAAILDAILYPFFPMMQVCYNCNSEMRGYQTNPKLDRFSHETKAHYEYGNRKHPVYQE